MKKFALFWIIMLSCVFYKSVDETPHGNQKQLEQTHDQKKLSKHYQRLLGSTLYFDQKHCCFPKPPQKNVAEQAVALVKDTITKIHKMFINT